MDHLSGLRMPVKWMSSVALLLMGGCATYPAPTDFSKCNLHSTPLVAASVLEGSRSPSVAPLVRLAKVLADCSTRTSGSTGDATFKAILISGGGADGAYGTGFLSYMIEDQGSQHPLKSACLITGVSTGAVMAPFILLATSSKGDPKGYLKQLQKLYLHLDDKILLSRRPLPMLAFSASIFDVQGIKDVIERTVTDELLDDVADEGRTYGRQLLVGATNLYTGKFEVINLTDMASDRAMDNDQRRHCFGEAIRASAAIPIVFPPVPISDQQTTPMESKLFVDGGIRHVVFLFEELFRSFSADVKSEIFGVINATFELGTVAGKLSIPDLGERNAVIVLDQLNLDSAFLVDAAAEAKKAQRYWTSAEGAIDIEGDKKSCSSKKEAKTIFDPAYQQCLYTYGRARAQEPGWQKLKRPPTAM